MSNFPLDHGDEVVNTPPAGDDHEPVTQIAAVLASIPRTKKNADLRWYWRQQRQLARYVARINRRLAPELILRKRLAEAEALRDWRSYQPFPTARDTWTDQTWPVMDECGAPPARLLDYRSRKINEIVIERVSADLDLVQYRDAADDASHDALSDLGLFRGPRS